MAASLEETLISVWRQAMAEEAKTVILGDQKFPVRRTSRSRLREVDFPFEGHELRGLEQNPEKGSRWARKEGHAVSAATPVYCGCGGRKSAVLRQKRRFRKNSEEQRR